MNLPKIENRDYSKNELMNFIRQTASNKIFPVTFLENVMDRKEINNRNEEHEDDEWDRKLKREEVYKSIFEKIVPEELSDADKIELLEIRDDVLHSAFLRVDELGIDVLKTYLSQKTPEEIKLYYKEAMTRDYSTDADSYLFPLAFKTYPELLNDLDFFDEFIEEVSRNDFTKKIAFGDDDEYIEKEFELNSIMTKAHIEIIYKHFGDRECAPKIIQNLSNEDKASISKSDTFDIMEKVDRNLSEIKNSSEIEKPLTV